MYSTILVQILYIFANLGQWQHFHFDGITMDNLSLVNKEKRLVGSSHFRESKLFFMFLPIDCFASCLASLTHALCQIKHALRLWDYIHTLLHCFWFISVACLCRFIHFVPFAKLATGPSHVIKLHFFFRTLMYYYLYCFVFLCTTLFL